MGKRSVLFAEDDRLFLEAIGEFLEQQGYQVRRAADGLEALQALWDNPPDVILLDLIMPKIDGGRLCRYVREDPRFQHIPIVVFSGLAARDIARMPDVSADAYVAKGPIQVVAKNVLAAVQHLEAHGRSIPSEEAVYGYEGFRPRRLITELLSLRRHSDLLLHTMSEGVLRADENDRIFYASPMALAMLEKGEQALIGAKLWDAFPLAYREEVERTAEKLRTDSNAAKQEFTISLKGRPFKTSFAPLWEDEVYGGLLLLLLDLGHFGHLQNS